MQCLKCPNEAAPGKALCESCFQGRHQEHTGRRQAWDQDKEAFRAEQQEKYADSGDSLAGFWLRVGAWFFDAGLLSLIYFSILFVAKLLFLGSSSTGLHMAASQTARSALSDEEGGVGAVISIFMFFFTFLYYVVCEGSRLEATPGKLLYRMRVANKEGEPIGFLKAAMRYAGRFISTILWICGGIAAAASLVPLATLLFALGIIVGLGDNIVVAFSERKQSFHDMVAGTLVLLREPFYPQRFAIALFATLIITGAPLILLFVV